MNHCKNDIINFKHLTFDWVSVKNVLGNEEREKKKKLNKFDRSALDHLVSQDSPRREDFDRYCKYRPETNLTYGNLILDGHFINLTLLYFIFRDDIWENLDQFNNFPFLRDLALDVPSSPHTTQSISQLTNLSRLVVERRMEGPVSFDFFPDIGLLTQLRILEINLSLTDEDPHLSQHDMNMTFPSLFKLNYLNITGYQIPEGVIPSSIFSLSHLCHLELINCGLSGNIHLDSFLQLSCLRTLSLIRNNKLTGF